MDPFSQSSMSPSDFFNGLELAHQQQHQQHLQQHQQQQSQHQQLQPAVVQPGPRNYKSRKYRPCDFCRQRQVQCKIEIAPPCQLCSSHARECTFVERPKKKRRPNTSAGGESSSLRAIDPALTNDHAAVHMSNGIDNGMPNGFVPQYDGHLFDRAMGHDQFIDPQMSPHQPHGQAHPLNGMDPNGAHEYKPLEYSGRSSTVSSNMLERPLDSQATRSARFIGETGESNPYLLRHYRYDENEECTVSKLTYRRIKKISQQTNTLTGDWGEPPVVFMLADDSLAQKGEPRIEDDVLAKARHDISSMFTEEEALRLVGLFFRFVNPYFPILARSEFLSPNGNVAVEALHSMPLSLISAIYATSLPFMLYDDLLATTIVHNPPSAHQLYRISWLSVVNELHTPRLATLQTCLLLLQRAPTNRYTTDTPWKTSLVGWTVSLAQILGLTRECGDWATLPSWEINLRKRLWYAVYIMDKWASLGAGMPSHIRNEDYDVLPLLPSNCEIMAEHEMAQVIGDPGLSEADAHFRLLSELTMILSDIMDAYYSLRATQQTSKDFGLSLDLARSLRTRLKAWNDSLPSALKLRAPDRVDARGMAKLSGNPSLSLAYIVATMTLFRALLRPLENLTSVEEEDHGIVGSRNAVRAGAKECAKEVVEFVENLGRGALDAFWHSWSRANFAIASSFLMQLLLTSETAAESAEINDLVHRWRWAMRIGSGSTGSGLMSLGLLRLDGLLLESGSNGSQGHGQVGIGADGSGNMNVNVMLNGGPRGSVGSG